MKRYISILFTFGIILSLGVLTGVLMSSCKKEKSVFAVADFSYSGRIDTVPTTIQFINKSFGISYMWDFGDGSGSTEKNPRHTFNQPGTYNVKLIAKGSNNSDTLEVVIGIGDFIPINGLVGWWPKNGNANDESGNGNHGTVYGATLTTDRFGNQNGAYNFDGVDDFINVADHPDLRLVNTNFTLSTWYKVHSFGLANRIFIIKTDGPGSTNKWSLMKVALVNGGPAASFHTNGILGNFHLMGVSPENTDWHQLIVRYNGGVFELFEDAILIATSSTIQMQSSNLDIRIGGDEINGGGHWHNGKLDDIGIWNRALTQQEITNLYNGGR